MGFDELFEEGTIVPPGPGAVDLMQPQPGMDFASTMGPAMEFEAAHVPVSNPAELEPRKAGWMKVWQAFQSNPNLQRAMMMVGANLAQPIQPGQTTGGAMAQSAIVGMNAYQLGQKEDFQKQMLMRREGREDARLGFEERRTTEAEKSGATSRAASAASTRSTLLDIETKTKTQADDIRRGKALADKAVADVKDFQDNEGIRKAERALKEQEFRIRESIPETARRQAELDKLEETRVNLNLKRQQARKAGAEASVAEAEAKMTPEQRALARSGARSTAEIQWGQLEKAWKASPELQRQHPDMNKYLADSQTQARENPNAFADTLTKTIDTLSKNDPLRKELERQRTEFFRGRSSGRAPAAGAAPTPGAGRGSSPETALPWPGEARLADIPPGTWVIGPDGVPRRKKTPTTNPREAR